MTWYNLFIATTLIAGGACAPLNHVRHEKRDIPMTQLRRRVEPDAIVPIRIALKQSNLHLGYDHLMEVSDPKSESYGKHFSAKEVHDIFAPAEETIQLVKAWLISSGLDEGEIMHYENKGWLALDIPASHAERLLSAEYHEHDGPDSRTRIGCDEYYLPAHLTDHIDFVKPGVKLSSPLSKKTVKRGEQGWPGHHRPGWPGHHPPSYPYHHMPHHRPPPGSGGLPPDLQNCATNMTPICIRALYDIPKAHFHQPENVMGLYETYDAFSQVDLDLFFKNFAPNVPQGTTPKVDSIDGGTANVAPGDDRNTGESDIDLDLAYALIYPQTVTVYQVDDLPNASGATNKTGYMNDFFDAVDGSYCTYTAYGITGNTPSIDPVYPDPMAGGYKGKLMCGTYPLTRVVSISYGESEITLPKRYSERQCNEIMKLGLQGHTILVASGDYGVASFPGDNGDEYGCLSGYGQNGTIYNPDNLSSCPYMTSVGGTMLYSDQTVRDQESAMQVNLTAFNIATGEGTVDPTLQFFGTSGGFSNYFTPPSYQKAAVAKYLARVKTPPSYVANKDATNIGEHGGVYNRAGRGYPDVSANGVFLSVYNNATLSQFFGTSLSSPIFGSVITLINEERTAAGKGPVGFVNPVLYAHPEVLNDVVNGSNPNCKGTGFYASKGWDPVTGLGTPNYPKMLKLFMGLK